MRRSEGSELASIIAMEVILFDLIFHNRHWKRFVAMNLDFYLCSEIGMWRSSKTCIEKHARNVWRSSKHLFGWMTLSRTSVLYKVHFSILALDDPHGRAWSWLILKYTIICYGRKCNLMDFYLVVKDE